MLTLKLLTLVQTWVFQMFYVKNRGKKDVNDLAVVSLGSEKPPPSLTDLRYNRVEKPPFITKVMSCFDDSKVDRTTLEGMLPAVMFGPEMEYLKNTTKDAARESVSNTWQIPYEINSEDSDGNTKLHNPNGIENTELQSYCMGLKYCHPATLGFFPRSR